MLNVYPSERRGAAMAIWGMGVMVGPILGPTLGGYLTELYNWRYVFYVNLPFGIATTLGLLWFLPAERSESSLRFDWFGFTVLALGLSGLQLMLDRGETQDWFNSTEIIIEAVTAAGGFYLFFVHLLTAQKPFITPRIFLDRSFALSTVVMFAVGMVLLASSALLAPWLEDLGGYPVETAGLLLAPRGIGTMLALLIAGKISNSVDPRWVMALGVALLSWSLWRLSAWTPAVDEVTLAVNTTIQGAGLGFTFLPLNVVAFATLPARSRYEGAALMSLLRNIGSAVGVSIFEALQVNSAEVEHSVLAPFASPLNRTLQTTPQIVHLVSPATRHGAALLDQMIGYQAQVIAYNNDYWLMGVLALLILLLLPFMRRPRLDAKDGGPAMSE
jgi:DHA2 family multidrug resistance protein